MLSNLLRTTQELVSGETMNACLSDSIFSPLALFFQFLWSFVLALWWLSHSCSPPWSKYPVRYVIQSVVLSPSLNRYSRLAFWFPVPKTMDKRTIFYQFIKVPQTLLESFEACPSSEDIPTWNSEPGVFAGLHLSPISSALGKSPGAYTFHQ